MTSLLDADEDRIAGDDMITGRAYEMFVAMELARLLPYTRESPRMHHWRTQHGDEVDLVLENRRGKIVGVEIKSWATVGAHDLRGLAKLGSLAGERFQASVVLCTIRQTVPLGGGMWAVPIAALWND